MSVGHVCLGSFDRPDHPCYCGIGRNHTEVEHRAAMRGEDLLREIFAVESETAQ